MQENETSKVLMEPTSIFSENISKNTEVVVAKSFSSMCDAFKAEKLPESNVIRRINGAGFWKKVVITRVVADV